MNFIFSFNCGDRRAIFLVCRDRRNLLANFSTSLSKPSPVGEGVDRAPRKRLYHCLQWSRVTDEVC